MMLMRWKWQQLWQQQSVQQQQPLQAGTLGTPPVLWVQQGAVPMVVVVVGGPLLVQMRSCQPCSKLSRHMSAGRLREGLRGVGMSCRG
jgi:hypothetical protein